MRIVPPLLAALALAAAPAGAQQSVTPATPGIWGFAYEEQQPGQSAAALVERNAISCLAEPALVARAAEGYLLTSYRVDVQGLAGGAAGYFIQLENLCSYDAASGLESCQRLAEAGDALYWTYYAAIDAAAGVYRAHILASQADLDAFRTSGEPPEGGTSFVTFLCPAGQRPERALLQAARRDDAASEAAYEAMLENFDACGYPLCGEALQHLQRLIGD